MASVNSREVIEGVQYQGVDESVAYTIDVSAVGSSPGSILAVVKDVTGGNAVVTSTVMPVNAPTVDGNVISLSPLKLLTAGHLYRVEVRYTLSGNVLESYFFVQGQE